VKLAFLFWAGIVLLLDSAVGLWGLNFLRKMAPAVNFKRIALVEAVVAFLLIGAYYLLKAP
jgi:hypothetical protein